MGPGANHRVGSSLSWGWSFVHGYGGSNGRDVRSTIDTSGRMVRYERLSTLLGLNGWPGRVFLASSISPLLPVILPRPEAGDVGNGGQGFYFPQPSRKSSSTP